MIKPVSVIVLFEKAPDNTGMYASDLDPRTKSKLRETQNVALSQTPVKHHLPRWMKRTARKVAHKLHLA